MRAGFYECDITPPIGGYMPGQYYEVLAEKVLEKLYAKAVVIENDGELAAIVAVDTCSLPAEMHDIVTQRIQEYTGIDPSRVCISSDHTHKGAPILDDGVIECYGDAPYRDVFYRLTADAVIMAYSKLEEVSVGFGVKKIPGLAFCRNYKAADGTLFTHGRGKNAEPLAQPDEDLSVITFSNEKGPVGALINFSCHQDCVGGNHGYTGDYSSVLANRLKDEYGRQFVSVFALGACGDVNHVNPDENVPIEKYHYRMMGDTLAEAAKEIIKSSQSVDGKVAVVKEKIVLNRRPYDKQTVEGFITKYLKDEGYMRLHNIITYAKLNRKTCDEVYVQYIGLGDIGIAILPGEIYAAFGLQIKAMSPFKYNIVMENCNSECGYIPTEDVFSADSNLYETALCFASCHVPEAGQIITDKALELSNQMYDKLN